MVNIRYHHCAYASRASMAQRDNRSVSLFICCYYLFALLYHVVAVVIGKIVLVGS